MNINNIYYSVFSREYRYIFILVLVIYSLFNFWLNDLFVLGFEFLKYSWYISIPFSFFLIINSLLVAININLLIARYKLIKSITPEAGFFGAIGTFFALLAGACPGCVAGFFPVVAGVFGSTITLSSLPFYGVEIQLISFLFLLMGMNFMSNDFVCSAKIKKG